MLGREREAEVPKENAKLKLWKQRRSEYRKSGLSRKAFCAKHRMKLSSLDYWFCRISKLEKAAGLVEVNPSAIVPVDSNIAVVVAQRFRVEVQRGFDRQLLGEVLQTLESLQ